MASLPPRDTRIATRRLLIRPPTRGDFAAWSSGRAASRAHLEPFEPRWSADALTRSDWSRRLRAWRAGWAEDRAYIFLTFEAGEDLLIGGISVNNVRRGPAQTGSIGYWLLRPATGKGYMTEALSAVCGWCFTSLALHRLEAATLYSNERSQRVLQRCGFQEEGRARSYLEINGSRRDHVLFARLREDTVR